MIARVRRVAGALAQAPGDVAIAIAAGVVVASAVLAFAAGAAVVVPLDRVMGAWDEPPPERP